MKFLYVGRSAAFFVPHKRKNISSNYVFLAFTLKGLINMGDIAWMVCPMVVMANVGSSETLWQDLVVGRKYQEGFSITRVVYIKVSGNQVLIIYCSFTIRWIDRKWTPIGGDNRHLSQNITPNRQISVGSWLKLPKVLKKLASWSILFSLLSSEIL